jgi:hypothetical protein
MPRLRTPAAVVSGRRFVDECVELVRRAYVGTMLREAVRQKLNAAGRDHQLDKARSKAYADASALATVAAQVKRLAAAGTRLEELLRLPEALYLIVLDLAGDTPRSLDQIDQDETRLNGRENDMQMHRRVHGETPARLREEAEIAQRLVTLNAERARSCTRRALELDLRAGVPA